MSCGSPKQLLGEYRLWHAWRFAPIKPMEIPLLNYAFLLLIVQLTLLPMMKHSVAYPNAQLFSTYSADPVSKKCVKSCPFPYFKYNTTRKCETNCNSTSWYFKDPSTKTCVSICPTMPICMPRLHLMTCVDTCSGGFYHELIATQWLQQEDVWQCAFFSCLLCRLTNKNMRETMRKPNILILQQQLPGMLESLPTPGLYINLLSWFVRG